MTGTRQETAAEYLRAAATQLRGDYGPYRLTSAVADWLYEESCCEEFGPIRPLSSRHHSLAVAAAVLGRPWPS